MMKTFIELDNTLLTHESYDTHELYLIDIGYDMLKYFTEIKTNSIEEAVDAYIDMLELFIAEAKVDAIKYLTYGDVLSLRKVRAYTYLIELEQQILKSLISKNYDAQITSDFTVYIEIHK